MDPSKFLTVELVIPLLVALVCGALGGLARALGSAPASASPGIASLGKSMLVGAVAAVAGFYVLDPESELRFVAAALISGYSGPALLDALDARFRVLAAEARTTVAISAGRAALENADAMLLRVGLQPNSASGPLAPADPVAAARAHLDVSRARLDALDSTPSSRP